MPIISAILGAVGTFVAAAGSFIAPLAGAFGGLGALGKVALSIGLNLAISALQKKTAKKDQVAEAPSGTVLDLEFGEGVNRKVMCGRFSVSGHFTYANAHGEANGRLQQVFTLSDFPVSSLDRVWIDGELATFGVDDGTLGLTVTSGDYAGKIWIKLFDGWQAAAAAGLVAGSNPTGRWTADHVGLGMAFVVVTMDYDREKLTQPPQFQFECSGAPLYDWRKDTTVGGSGAHRWNDSTTWEFTENPILMAYAYHRGIKFNGDLFCGMEVAEADLPLSKWTLAANICDETKDLAPRYRCSIGLDCGVEHGDNIEAIMAACGGMLVTGIGEIYVIVGTDQPIVATITDDDLIVGQAVSFQRRRSMDELVNSVSGTFPNPDNQWGPTSYETALDPATVAIDRRTRDVAINFGTVPYAAQAGQLANIYLSENRFEAVATITVRPRWQVLEIGDWITWNSARYGSRTYMVTDMQLMSIDAEGPRNVVLSLQERSGDTYSDIGIAIPPIPLGPATPVYASELQDFTVTAATGVGSDSQVYPIIRASWAAPTDPTVAGVILQWRPAADVDAIFERSVSVDRTVAIMTEGVVRATAYQVRHILVTDPPRTVVASAWKDVFTTDPDGGDITVGLSQVRTDIYKMFETLRVQMDDLESRVDLSGGNAAADTAERFLERRVFSKTQEGLSARVVTEVQARVDGDVALASTIDSVNADYNGRFAGGLVALQATAAPGGVDARFSVMLRAGTGDAYKSGGFYMDLRTVSGTQRSEFAVLADRFAVTDGGNTSYPMVYEGGVLKLALAHIGAVTAGTLTSSNGKVLLDLTNARLLFSD